MSPRALAKHLGLSFGTVEPARFFACVHEAGHATVLHALRVGVAKVEVGHDGSGRVTHTRLGRDLEARVRQAMVDLAGAAAETLESGVMLASDGCEADLLDAWRQLAPVYSDRGQCVRVLRQLWAATTEILLERQEHLTLLTAELYASGQLSEKRARALLNASVHLAG